MEKKFKPGDLVVLKSGGPTMTIVGYYGSDEEVTCDWFDEKNVKQRDTFHEDTLLLVE